MKQRLILFNTLMAISTGLYAEIAYNPHNLGSFSISLELYEYICNVLPENATILELGSGSGTAELARYYTTYSIEHDQKWLNRYAGPRSFYIFAPIRQYKNYRWYNIDHLIDHLPEKYDLILIDGPLGSIGRYGFYHHLELFNINVPIIFDDINRPAELKLCQDVAKKLGRAYETIYCPSDKKSFGIIFPGN